MPPVGWELSGGWRRRPTTTHRPASLLEQWQLSVLRVSALGAAAISLCAPLLYWGLLRRRPEHLVLLVVLGALMLAIPWGVRGASDRNLLRVRSAALVVALAFSLAFLGLDFGWSPGVVAVSCALVVISALLLGRWGLVPVLGAQAAALLVGGGMLQLERFRPVMALLTPAVFPSWMRETAFVAVISALIAMVLHRAGALIGDTFSDAQQSLSLATARLSASREARAARIRAERKLRDPQKVQAVGQLSSGLAHLLNNALMVVRGSLEELTEEPGAATRKRVAATIVGTMLKVGHAVRELMVFTRQEAQETQSLDLMIEVRQFVDGLRPTLREDVELRVQGPPGLMVELEPSRLRQVLLNLLLNAMDALPRGGRVRVTAGATPCPGLVAKASPAGGDGWCAELLVEDDGEGMDARTSARATDAFFTSRSRDRHAGLGLTVVAGVVEQAGGSLRIETGPDVGTRVRVVLPLRVGADEAQALADEAEPEEQPALLLPARIGDGDEPRAGAPAVDELDGIPLSAEADSWRSEISARIARWSALGLAAIQLVMLAVGFPISPFEHALFLAIVLLLAFAGWVTLSASSLAVLLSGACGALAVHEVAAHSYLAPAAIASIVAAVSWAALLGRRRAYWVLLALLSAALLLVGWFFAIGTLSVDLGQVTMTLPDNWRRIAVNLSLVQLVMGASTVAIVGHARRGVRLMAAAQHGVSAAQKAEEEEGARQLLVEREISRSERMVATGRAAGTVAHDLNNALQGLLGAAYVLDGPDLEGDGFRVATRSLWQSFEYARALATQFAVFRSNVPTSAVSVDLSAEVRAALRMLPPIVRSKATVESAIADGAFVRIDASSVRRLLFNLVANARDAIETRGEIRVSLRCEGARAVLEVRDDGRGMDESTRARLFEPFFTTKGEGQGTGLGLYSVARILEANAGEVQVESTPGLGTTVTVSWPLAPAPPTPVAAGARTDGTQGRQGTVLVVEDEPAVRAFMVRTLAQAGYLVREASDGETARRLVDTVSGCVGLCIDGVIPGPPSSEIIEAFSQRHPDCPVVLCSGHLPEVLERRGLLNERVSFLPKPFEPRQLLEALTRGAARARQLLG